MSFKEAIVTCFRKYADFSGRARRSEYWWFTLFNYLVSMALGLVAMELPFFSVISGLYSLAILIPGLAVCWRRFHDIGKSGACYFLIFIPLVGPILLLVWFCKNGQSGPNRFGPDPKEPVSDSAPWEY